MPYISISNAREKPLLISKVTELTIYSPVVTICTASGHFMYHQFNIHKSYVLPTHCIYVFCVDLRTNSDNFPIQHLTDWFFFITETECAYWAVRTGSFVMLVLARH
jgi:hypothetical protein